MSETRCCEICMTRKPLEEFRPLLHYRLKYCKACESESKKARAKALKEKGLEFAKQRMKELACKQQSK